MRLHSAAWVFALAGLLGSAAAAPAQTSFYWTNTGSEFDTPGSWIPNAGNPTQPADVANFTPQFGTTVVQPHLANNATITIQNLNFANTPLLGGYTLSGSGTYMLGSSSGGGGVTTLGTGMATLNGPSV